MRVLHDPINRALGFGAVNAAMTSGWTRASIQRLPAGTAAPLQQSLEYQRACALSGATPCCYRLVDRSGRLLGAALGLVRRVPMLGEALLLSRGPLWAPDLPDESRAAGLAELLDITGRRFRLVAVTADPVGGDDPMVANGWLQTTTAGTLARIDLDGSEADLRARLNGKWRNRLGRAEGAGLKVRHSPMLADVTHPLLVEEARQARQRRYRRLPAAFTRDWCAANGQDSTRLFVAEWEGRTIAAMLFLLHGGGASYHIGWSGADGRRTNAHNLLLWRAMTWMAGRGIRFLDLDSIDTRAAPGLARFKLGAGAQALQLGATWIRAPGSRLFAARPSAGLLRAADPAGSRQVGAPAR